MAEVFIQVGLRTDPQGGCSGTNKPLQDKNMPDRKSRLVSWLVRELGDKDIMDITSPKALLLLKLTL